MKLRKGQEWVVGNPLAPGVEHKTNCGNLPPGAEDAMKRAGRAAADRMFADPNWRNVLKSYNHLMVNGKPWDENHPQWPEERKE